MLSSCLSMMKFCLLLSIGRTIRTDFVPGNGNGTVGEDLNLMHILIV